MGHRKSDIDRLQLVPAKLELHRRKKKFEHKVLGLGMTFELVRNRNLIGRGVSPKLLYDSLVLFVSVVACEVEITYMVRILIFEYQTRKGWEVERLVHQTFSSANAHGPPGVLEYTKGILGVCYTSLRSFPKYFLK